VDTRLTLASGTAERDAAAAKMEHKPTGQRKTLGGGRGYGTQTSPSSEHGQPAQRDRCTHRRTTAQDKVPWAGSAWFDVHLRGCGYNLVRMRNLMAQPA